MAQQNDSKASDPDAQSVADPMTTQSGLDGAAKDVGADTASPYGTRSRNRNGYSRINYAEDKDIDADVYDYYHDKKDGDSKKTSRQSSAAVNSDAPRGGASSRKAGTDEVKAAQPVNPPKEQQSGGSSNASTTTQPPVASQPTRKRKVATQSAGSTSQATSTNNSSKKTSATGPPAGISWPETNMLTFDDCKGRPVDGRMVADDGTVLEPNDHVYLVCEPPGEPYYLGRIMEFLHVQNNSSKPVEAIRINWYYRPKDIGRKTTDTRMVFATMHSDISPLTALRGKCQIRHKAEIPSLDAYRKTPDSFWFDKLYDRYIQKNYDLIPTRSIVNVPANVKKVLDERWKYVLVEQGRGKELTSAVKLCKRCTGYCASRAQERKLEARNTPNVNDPSFDGDDDDLLDEEDEEMQGVDTTRTSPDEEHVHHEGTAEQVYQASLWPYRYLGMHCKPEDALDYDDRIYPRASTRIGPRNQATVLPWPGQPVEYVKPLEMKKNGKKDAKFQAALEAEKASRGKRPKWVQDMPPGYTVRGEDHDEDDPNCTAKPMWIPPSEEAIKEAEINQYMEKAKGMANDLGLPERSTNLQDVAADTLFHSGFDTKRALKTLSETEKAAFKEPELTPMEQKKFEEAVIKYGSELYLVRKHVKSMYYGMVTRYYYAWKKSDRGKQVLENQAGRKGKKEAKRAEAAASKLADDVADNDDDSAFDTEKANQKKRGFMCQFCSTTSSLQWRRAPNPIPGIVNDAGAKNSTKEKGQERVIALCRRCAELWRRYAIRWEDLEEVAKKVAQSGGRAWKRKQDEELLKELQAAKEMGMMTPERAPTPTAAPATTNGQEPPRKKLKGAPPDKDMDNGHSDAASAAGSTTSKKKDKSVESVAVPEMPKPRVLPCAVCGQLEPQGDQHLSCRECRLTVHRDCYGIMDNRSSGKWTCDMCANDKNPQVSIHYQCVLCPIEYTEHDFVEQPKLTHHKKKMSEKDRERERLEVQQARKAAEFYRKKQEEMNRPVNPREPLKRTADNNWVHVTCAVWTPEVKFGNAKALEPSEGIPSIPRSRYDETCQVCNKKDGACVSCHQCRIPLHVECARQQGHVLGFDLTPVKSSRRDQFNIVTINGESGTMSATVWCKDHAPTKTTVHQMHEVVDDSGLNILQLYVQNFKQADLTLTGTVRKANLMTNAAKLTGTTTQPGLRRSSTTNIPAGVSSQQRNGETGDVASDSRQPGEKVCITCGIDVSPKWWPIDNTQERELTNGHYGTLGSEAQKFVEQRRFQCHKCRKAQRTAKPHPPRQSPVVVDVPLPQAPESLPVAAPPLHSPPQVMPAHREPATYAWPPHAHVHAQAGPPPIQAPALVADHALGARPPAPHAYAAPPPQRPSYSEWGRPASQQGSPPRHMNGGPPLHSAPPMSNLSSLRPPPVAGPPPPAPPPGNHHGGHGPQPYANGLPPSPRRLNGPAPPARYVHPYQSHGHHGPPPAHLPPPNMTNGAPPPPPPRTDGFPHELHPQRPPYSTPQTSPPGSRNGIPPPQSRPASGASASPSLRNLLS
ncbi:putative PHD type zinc finger protein with BAH domain-containing protein [Fusarium torreyae]|uniref:PHD type zinc finger protein with BAH domain-containing protein n=1 Tax=Fusarium torreyae TaxID=1237075 RepID=A0A9W8SAR8_9HYPO|nr:putative PHD type zinc finger protein with BAH domain-containing protein [Fusarium torreyae]